MSVLRLLSLCFFPIDNNMKGEVTSLSEALKSNTTLTELNLSGEDKNTQKINHLQSKHLTSASMSYSSN